MLHCDRAPATLAQGTDARGEAHRAQPVLVNLPIIASARLADAIAGLDL
jgi:hypothetical protein